VGGGRQTFPDHGYDVTWLFVEQRARLLSALVWGERRTDLFAALRIGQAQGAGPRHHSPVQLGLGLFVSQRLSPARGRHGWRVTFGWQHGRLGDAVETEYLDTDRFLAGVTWVP
jgi:hypothetical protein